MIGYCDLSPSDLKINRVYLVLMTNLRITFSEPRLNCSQVIDRKLFYMAGHCDLDL